MLMMKRFNNILGEAGDTIIEVLIVLAILSLAFSISFATADMGLNKSQNAEEHSQAVGIVDAQLELLRNDIINQATGLTNPLISFCLNDNGGSISQPIGMMGGGTVPSSNNVDASASNDNYQEYPTNVSTGSCVVNNLYHESITYVSGGTIGPYYNIMARWNGLANLGPQQTNISYRITQLAADNSPFVNGGNPSGHIIGYDWSANGGQDTSCSVVAGDPAPNDAPTGCNDSLTGSDLYSYHEFNAEYLLSNPPSFGTPVGGQAKLTIDYRQYPGELGPNYEKDPNFKAPPGYKYNVTLEVLNSGGNVISNIADGRPGGPTTRSLSPVSNYALASETFIVNLSGIPNSVVVIWNNNQATTPTGCTDTPRDPCYNPNLDIVHLELTDN
jgi:type II secretory pathway pseudopilin PulG